MTPETNYSVTASPPPAPFFIYIITPQQVMTSTDTANPVTLYVGVYNPPANGFVPCQSIEFAISIGDTQENQLTDDPADIEGSANQSSWGIEKVTFTASPLIFRVTPATGITGLEAGESIGFELTGININSVAGPAPVRIAEATSDPPRMTQVLINKVPPTLQITLFQAVPPWVAPGGQTTLSWTTRGASSCSLVPLGNSLCQGEEPPPTTLPPTGELNVCPLQTTPYTLTAYAEGGGYVLRSFSVGVGALIESFTATPQSFIRGEPVTLAWETFDATSCSIDQGIGEVQPPDKGSVEVSPEQETTYILTASGIGQPSTKTVTATPQLTHWSTKTPPGVKFGFNNLVFLNYKNALWMIDTSSLLVFTSTDGVTWTQIEVTQPWTTRGCCSAAVFDDMMWLIGGGQIMQFPEPNDLWVSKDGASWSQYAPTPTGLLPRMNFGCVVYQDQLWLFGGQTSQFTSPTNDVWVSPDGFSWRQIQPSAAWSSRALFAATVFNNQIWLCGGQSSGFTPSYEAWYTSDGINWKQWNDGASPPSTRTPWNPGLVPLAQSLNNQLYLCNGAQLWVMDTNMQWTPAIVPAPWTDMLYNPASAIYNWQLWVTGFLPAGEQATPVLYSYIP